MKNKKIQKDILYIFLFISFIFLSKILLEQKSFAINNINIIQPPALYYPVETRGGATNSLRGHAYRLLSSNLNVSIGNYIATLTDQNGKILNSGDQINVGDILNIQVETPCQKDDINSPFVRGVSWYGDVRIYPMQSMQGNCISNFPDMNANAYHKNNFNILQYKLNNGSFISLALMLRDVTYNINSTSISNISNNQYRVLSSGIDSNGNCNISIDYDSSEARFYYSEEFLSYLPSTWSEGVFDVNKNEYSMNIPAQSINYSFKCINKPKNTPPKAFFR